MKWFCKTCGYDMTQGVEKFMVKRVVILVCPNKHASRFRYEDGVEVEK